MRRKMSRAVHYPLSSIIICVKCLGSVRGRGIRSMTGLSCLYSALYASMSHFISASPWWCYTVLLLTAVQHVYAGFNNITVDDTSQGIQYSPFDAWSTTNPCNTSRNPCNIVLDGNQVYNRTWHGTAYTPGQASQPSLSFNFSGTAVYVYGVILDRPPPGGTFTLSTNLQVYLDKSLTQSNNQGVWNSSSGPIYQYNALIFQKSDLPSGDHTLQIQAVNNDSAIILFDYIVYTMDSGDSTPSSFPAVASTFSGGSSASSLATTTLSPPSLGSPLGSAPPSARPTSSSPVLQAEAVTTRILSLTTTFVEVEHNITTTIVSTGVTTIRSIVSASEPSTSTYSGSSPTGLSANAVHNSSTTTLGPIVGGTVGAVVAIALLTSGVYVYRARSKYRLAFVFEGDTGKDLEDRSSPELPPTMGGERSSPSMPAPLLPRLRTAPPPTRSTEPVHPSCVFPSPPGSPASSARFSGYLQPSMDGRSAESLLDHAIYPKPPPVLTLASGNLSPRPSSQQPSPASIVEVDTRGARLARLRAQVLRSSLHGARRSSSEQPRCEQGS
ncbi:hypothetical protein C8Q79DRAFT_111144 [Trametes meyenii]|nr:hypothetical protein C8Q79DRAFT_111144 [Trametes meyenii]